MGNPGMMHFNAYLWTLDSNLLCDYHSCFITKSWRYSVYIFLLPSWLGGSHSFVRVFNFSFSIEIKVKGIWHV